MAWIEKRGKRQVVRWETANPDGTTTTHSSGRLTEPKAKALVAKLRAKLPDRRRRKPGLRVADPSIASLCTQWEAAKAQEGGKSANYAKEAARRAGALADAAGITTTSQATAARIRAYRTTADSGCHRPLAYLRAVLAWAVEEMEVEIEPRFFIAARPPPSAESEHRLLTNEEASSIEAEARRLEQWPLVRCLMLYGWRPITACRLLVQHIDLAQGAVRLQVKRAKHAHAHPLHPEAAALLRPLVEDRPPGAPLFLNRAGKPWRTRGDDADGVTKWYRDNLQEIAPDAGGTNALKRWALYRMAAGLDPWPRPLSLREIRLFTGHKTDSQAARYLRHSTQEAQRLVVEKRGGTVVESVKPGASVEGSSATIPGLFDLGAPDSVAYAPR